MSRSDPALTVGAAWGRRQSAAAMSLTALPAAPPVTPGSRVTIAEPDFVGSAALVAITETVCSVATLAGAVYRPLLETAPTFGVTDQTTAGLPLLATIVVNCWVWPGETTAVLGKTMTLGGSKKSPE